MFEYLMSTECREWTQWRKLQLSKRRSIAGHWWGDFELQVDSFSKSTIILFTGLPVTQANLTQSKQSMPSDPIGHLCVTCVCRFTFIWNGDVYVHLVDAWAKKSFLQKERKESNLTQGKQNRFLCHWYIWLLVCVSPCPRTLGHKVLRDTWTIYKHLPLLSQQFIVTFTSFCQGEREREREKLVSLYIALSSGILYHSVVVVINTLNHS